MGHYAIQDLIMAGVQWEVTDTKTNEQKKPTQETFQTNHVSTKPVIIPAAAPITLDTVNAMVARPVDIDSLVRMVAEFNHPLRSGATNVAMPNIAKNPNGLVIITDMPNADDDLSGHILSGVAGEMIDKMLSAIDMSRDNVSIIPLVFWRTPGGRTPTNEEMNLIRPFTNKMIEMLKPKVVITLGTLATNEIAQTNLTSVHGSEIKTDKGYTIVPLFHPNYLILKPSAKRDVWTALQNVQKMLKNS